MQHLFSSTVQVQRATTTFTDGIPSRAWSTVCAIKGRLDLHHKSLAARPERAVLEAGTVPDLTGTFFCADTDIRLGDRLEFVAGPHTGRIFSVEDTPAQAVGYAEVSHLEWAVQEVTASSL